MEVYWLPCTINRIGIMHAYMVVQPALEMSITKKVPSFPSPLRLQALSYLTSMLQS